MRYDPIITIPSGQCYELGGLRDGVEAVGLWYDTLPYLMLWCCVVLCIGQPLIFPAAHIYYYGDDQHALS